MVQCRGSTIEGRDSIYNLVYGSFHAKSAQKMDDPLRFPRNLGLQVEPHDLLAHSKFWPPKLSGFYFTALRKLNFSSIFAVPDHTKQTVFSFLLHLRRHFLHKSVAYEEFSYMVEQD